MHPLVILSTKIWDWEMHWDVILQPFHFAGKQLGNWNILIGHSAFVEYVRSHKLDWKKAQINYIFGKAKALDVSITFSYILKVWHFKIDIFGSFIWVVFLLIKLNFNLAPYLNTKGIFKYGFRLKERIDCATEFFFILNILYIQKSWMLLIFMLLSAFNVIVQKQMQEQ